MGWLNRWFGRRATSAAPWSFPRRLDVVPDTLALTVFAHDLTTLGHDVPCWTFVSDGLLGYGQKELVLTVARRPDEHPEAVAAEMSRLLATVHRFALQNQRVDEGDISVFGGPGPGGATGVAYLRTEPVAGVDLPRSALAVIPLMGAEVQVARDFGVTRVMGRLASHYRHYPCPPWWDRGRQAFAASMGEDTSVLSKIARVRVAGLSARLEGTRIRLRVQPSAAERLARTLAEAPAGAAFAFLTDVDRGADGLLVWRPGTEQLQAATPEGSRAERLSLCFVAFGVGADFTGARIIEDGALVTCVAPEWERFRQAVAAGERMTLAPTLGNVSLDLDWVSNTYLSPVDGSTYGSDGEWTTYQPDQPPAPGVHRVIDRVALLTGESELAERVTVEALTEYMLGLERAFVTHVGDRPERVEIFIRVELHPGQPAQVLGRGDLADDRIVELFSCVPAPVIRGGPVAFECRLSSRSESL